MKLIAESDVLKCFFGSSAALFAGNARNGQCQLNIGKHCLVGDKVVALKNEADGVVAVGVPIAVGVFLCGNTVYNEVTAVVAVKSADNIEQGCFSRTAWAEYGNKLVIAQIKADSV